MKLSRPLILLSLAALTPLVVLAAVLGVSASRQQQLAIRREAEARVDLAATLVDRELERQVAVLTALAQAPVFDGPPNPAALAGFFARVRSAQPLWRAMVVSDPQGLRLGASRSAPGSYPERVVEMDSHREVVRTLRPVIGPVTRRPTGVIAFAVRVPVIRDGQVRYVLSAVIEPDGVRKVLLSQPLPPTWRAGVLDSAGRVVVRINGSQDIVGRVVSPKAIEERRRASSGFVEGRSPEGERTINAFRVLPGAGWSVYAAIPYAVYQEPIALSLWLVGITATLSLMLAGVFLWLLARELRLRQQEAAALEEGRRMEALGRMTGGVAHDFNNLLMIVQGSAEMLKRRRGDPGAIASLADNIFSAAQRGQALTRQLLAFARRSRHDAVPVRLQDHAGELAELVRRSVRENIATTISIPLETWPVQADPNALEIALINLAVNARDAMPAGGALAITAANCSLQSERGAAPGLTGDFVAITVKDSGVGIAEADLGHVFEPFFTTKPAGRGTGLGLSQVYGFVRQSGGAVTVASRPGEGAAFTLYLPRSAATPAEPPAPAVAPAPVAVKQEGRLLLIEDDPEVAKTVEGMLAGAGYSVVWVANGPSAMTLIDAGEVFDAVLSDVMMEGGLSGSELAALLKLRRPDLPVVLMTGYPDAMSTGAADEVVVLAKPFDADTAVAALQRARAAAGGQMGRRRQARA